MRKLLRKCLPGLLLSVGLAAPALAVDATVGPVNVAIGGYVKLDTIWTNKMVDNAAGPTAVPVDNPSKNHNNFLMDARESRLNFTGTTTVEGVKLKGFIEGDFYGTWDGNEILRLRHAYLNADFGNGFSVLAGKAWSNSMPLNVWPPETIDFNGPAAQMFARLPQLRVTYDVPAAKFAVAGSIESSAESDRALPLFTARTTWSPGPAIIEATAIATQNRDIDGEDEEKEFAWGATLSGQVTLGPVTGYAHVQRLSGLNATLGNWDFADTAGSGSDFANIKATGVEAGASCGFGSTTFNAVFGLNRADNSTEQLKGSDSFRYLETFHVNVIQALWKDKVRVGLEYQFARGKYFNDDTGNYSRVQAGVWYNF